MGCHHRPHGGILHQQNLLDPLRPPDALVRAAGSTLHSLSDVSQLFQSALGIPWHEACRAGRADALAHPGEVPRAPKSPRCHQQLGGLKFVPVALAGAKLCLGDLDVTAPANSNVLGTVLDFVPVVAGGSQSRWHHSHREEGRGCVWGRAVVLEVPADSHEGAGKQLSWIWVSALGCSRAG